MKTKNEKTAKRIELKKLKIASLSKNQSNQIVGGDDDFSGIYISWDRK